MVLFNCKSDLTMCPLIYVDVIAHPSPSIKGGLTEPLLKLGRRWVHTSHCFINDNDNDDNVSYIYTYIRYHIFHAMLHSVYDLSIPTILQIEQNTYAIVILESQGWEMIPDYVYCSRIGHQCQDHTDH